MNQHNFIYFYDYANDIAYWSDLNKLIWKRYFYKSK